ncbi:hypothetical protein [Uliginosibacterium aquaticum]|uniref:Uncharacterized protein n=1 Tax=Uliginosibacterium aquaticum TaxID=2731212 RepID=A0ABX2ISH0_9RHOO|nr:hypothetical protein [Uliginosibacterium aquaticum]NSL57075.1 hypothetical protein [Uliginosibacterium aquaticum]
MADNSFISRKDQWLDLAFSKQTPVANKKRADAVLPGTKSKDFILVARCKIINLNKSVTMYAEDLPENVCYAKESSYAWSTKSNKIRITTPTSVSGGRVRIEALDTPSLGRDAEVITVTRTGADGSVSTKTVAVTVARVKLLASPSQNYGYDDYDTSLDSSDDHVSIESEKSSFVKVCIEGGAIGSDFEFACKSSSICSVQPPQASSDFDLQLDAGIGKKKQTVLQVFYKCPCREVFAELFVNVYAKKNANIVVAKIFDSLSLATSLKFASADYAAHTGPANQKMKDAVVKYDIQNYGNGSPLDVHFDLDLDGALSFDINNSGGAEFQAIDRAFVANGRFRVIVVRNLKSYYYLDQAAKAGDVVVKVRGQGVFSFPNHSMPLGRGSSQEMVTVMSGNGNVASLKTPLVYDHSPGEPLEFPAAGWSTDPIIICEGNTSLDIAKWTVVHEIGHAALGLSDVVDSTNVMHYDQGNVDYRLRFCPRVLNYNNPNGLLTENQWDLVLRS